VTAGGNPVTENTRSCPDCGQSNGRWRRDRGDGIHQIRHGDRRR
jgi:hypothetical protein